MTRYPPAPEGECPVCHDTVKLRPSGRPKMHMIRHAPLPPGVIRHTNAWCEGANPLQDGSLVTPRATTTAADGQTSDQSH